MTLDGENLLEQLLRGKADFRLSITLALGNHEKPEHFVGACDDVFQKDGFYMSERRRLGTGPTLQI